MRILIHDYVGHPFQVGLSRELARRGFDVVHAFAGGLITPRGCLARKKDDPHCLRFCEVPMNPNYRRDKYRFVKRRSYELAYGRELKRLIRTECPTLVLSGNTPSEPQWMAIKCSQGLGIPFVSWIQDLYGLAVGKLASRKSAILGKIAGYYYSRIDQRCLKHSAHTIAISEDFRPLLSRYGVPSKMNSVIENWGAIKELPRKERENDWTRQHGLVGHRVLMYTGTLAMKHNPELLLRLAVRFRDESSVKVVVVSEGPGAQFLKENAEKDRLTNLKVLPFQPFDSMPDVLASADVLLALLEPDAGIFSVPSKILTYLCAGKPTLAAMPRENLGARILIRNEAGLVVHPSDAKGFADAAEKLLYNDEFRTRLGDAARSYAEANFEIGTVADRFEKVFRLALK